MIELSEIQVAMCKVIKESGFEGLEKVFLNTYEFSVTAIEKWEVDVDGHTLTQEEYEAWAKQND